MTLVDLLKQLQILDSSKCVVKEDIAEIAPYPSEGHSFLICTKYWTPAWDCLRCTVERWAIADGISPTIAYQVGGNCLVAMRLSNGDCVTESSSDAAIATLSAYLQVKTQQQGVAG